MSIKPQTEEYAPVPNGGFVDKIQKNNWNTDVGIFGENRNIKKWYIAIDESYQRPSREKRVLEIASKWRWEAFGRVVVGERSNNGLFIVDGQHRLLAARKRSDVDLLPCIVFQSSGASEEAELFLILNTVRGPMTALERFQAQVITKDPIALAIFTAANELGLYIPKRNCAASTDRNTVSCVDSLIKSWNINSKCAYESLQLSKDITSDSMIHRDVYLGIFYLNLKLYKFGSSLSKYKERLVQIGDSSLKFYIKKHAIANDDHINNETRARGVLAAINKGLRSNKLDIPEEKLV